MCGIAGIVSDQPSDRIEKMADALVHRGPDAEGFYRGEGVALGFRRLSIIDLESGDQPIANESGELRLVCNGEIYNSPALRAELEERGHRFRTSTDVEVILHLYEELGERCVSRLRGMFAFALWDRPRRKLLLARDHMGQKPLFFWHDGDQFAFASEAKALLASGLIEPDIDLDGLWHYLSLRFVPDRYSFFRGIQKLPAATTLTLSEGKVCLDRYWEPSFNAKHSGSEEELAERLDVLLRKTVREHLLSDVRVGAFLSGGIDSSSVSAMMALESKGPVPSFSIGVEELGFDELPYARKVVERYGLESTEQVVQADLVDLIPSMVYHMDEPADPFGIGVYLVSRLASKSVKVVLGGDGGDENFAGYDRYLGQRLVDYYCLLPAWLRRSVVQRLTRGIPESFGYKSTAQKFAWVNEMSLFDRGDRYARSLGFLRFTADAREVLFTKEARAQITDPDSAAKILRFYYSENVSELVDRMLFTDLMTRMPDHLLAVVDRMSMAHSLESRSPLIDYRVVEFAAGVPSRMKLRGRNLKHLLKRVAARYLPDELINRRKQGFTFPLGLWMRNELRPLLEGVFKESRFVERGVFEERYVRSLLSEHFSGERDHNYRIWLLLNLEVWHRLYLEGETVESQREWLASHLRARRGFTAAVGTGLAAD